MKRLALALLALSFALPAAAELYRWTDQQGRVHYSDLPPPPSVKKMQRIQAPGTGAGTAASEPNTRPPVVLYTANCGATCDQSADFLRQRGVPFDLKNVQRDQAAASELRRRTGAYEVPVLFIGESMQRGYSPSVWDKMLEVAGYPAPAPARKPEPAEQGEAAPAEPPRY
jgi:glutaredoxin